MERMFRERFRERATAFDVCFDGHDQFLHGSVLVAIANDFKRLYQRNTSRQHRGELATENSDVTRGDRAATGKQTLALFLDAAGHNALASKIGTNGSLVGGHTLAFDLVALSVSAFPDKRGIAHYC